MVEVLQRLKQETEADRALAIHCVELDEVRVDHVDGVDLRGARDGIDKRGVVAQAQALVPAVLVVLAVYAVVRCCGGGGGGGRSRGPAARDFRPRSSIERAGVGLRERAPCGTNGPPLCRRRPTC